jgi:hydroxyethylthiazole kinase-like uncharacterized protein yjeF
MVHDPTLAPIARTADLRALEVRHAADGLMERAGAAAAEVARGMLADRREPVVVLAGPGNNGGDAFVVARLLRAAFFDVVVVSIADPAKLPKDAAAACAAYRIEEGSIASAPPAQRPALIVDGLFGVGLTRALSPDYAALVAWARRADAPILALDIPSGLGADDGVAREPTICATATATFIALKPGLLTGDGPDHCGEVSVHALGLEKELDHLGGRRLDWTHIARTLPATLLRRERRVHKGSFGTLGIVGGAHGMVGAPLLAGRAAMRLGAGKVWVGFVAADAPKVDFGAPELMLRRADQVFDGATALVCGPGLGQDADALALVHRATRANVPLVIDADAINLLASDPGLREGLAKRSAPTLLTPHPTEAARLLGCDTRDVEADRLAAALSLSKSFQGHVVLKGNGSVLAHPDGSFDINATGSPTLASAGSGDVLAGMLGALVAQRIDAKTALRIAVCLHGAAADHLVAHGIGPVGVGASELPDAARELLNRTARA